MRDIKNKPLRLRPWSSLTPGEKRRYVTYLSVISEMRLNKKKGIKTFLTEVCRERRVSMKALVRNMRPAFRKKGGRWGVTVYDRIPRVMKINENGLERTVEVNDSRIASMIGLYHNSVKNYFRAMAKKPKEKSPAHKKLLYEKFIKPYEGMVILDSSGSPHTLETDPVKLLEILERREEPEFYEIYDNR